MWRAKAPMIAALAVALVVLLACVGWAVLVEVMVTPACDLPTPPPNAGPLQCAVSPGPTAPPTP